jgi:formylmethanofuran dehydrogenase subunit C
MESVEVRKGKGSIDDVLGSHTEQTVEETMQIDAPGSKQLERAIERFELLMDVYVHVERKEAGKFTRKFAQDVLLNPGQIYALSMHIASPDRSYQFGPLGSMDGMSWAGKFLTAIIQNSYDAGHNRFRIDLREAQHKLCYLGHNLRGEKGRAVMLEIDGDVGSECGQGTAYAEFNIRGNAESGCGEIAKDSTFNITGNTGNFFGSRAVNSAFNIQGNVGNLCGREAEHSTFNIAGNAGKDCGNSAKHSRFSIEGSAGAICGGYAQHSRFEIHGNVGDVCGDGASKSVFILHGYTGNIPGFKAYGSTFKTPNDYTLRALKGVVPESGRIIYITPEGKEKRVRRRKA